MPPHTHRQQDLSRPYAHEQSTLIFSSSSPFLVHLRILSAGKQCFEEVTMLVFHKGHNPNIALVLKQHDLLMLFCRVLENCNQLRIKDLLERHTPYFLKAFVLQCIPANLFHLLVYHITFVYTSALLLPAPNPVPTSPNWPH